MVFTRNFYSLLWLLLLLPVLSMPRPVWGLEASYERARTPLEAKTVRESPLFNRPDSQGKAILLLNPSQNVIVLGRQGGWFDVEVQKGPSLTRGWIQAVHLRVVGAKEREETVVATPSPAVSQVKSPRGGKPVRLIPHVGYGYGAKNFPNQIRAGVDLLYALSPTTEIGGIVELGFLKQITAVIGPNFYFRWKEFFGLPVRPAAYGGFPFFYLSDNDESDLRFGLRFGGEVTWPLSGNLEAMVRAGADVLMFGGEQVAIPFIGAAGLSFRF